MEFQLKTGDTIKLPVILSPSKISLSDSISQQSETANLLIHNESNWLVGEQFSFMIDRAIENLEIYTKNI